MAGTTRYRTLTGEPPNGGILPDRLLALRPEPPPVIKHEEPLPSFPLHSPPAYNNNLPTQWHGAIHQSGVMSMLPGIVPVTQMPFPLLYPHLPLLPSLMPMCQVAPTQGTQGQAAQGQGGGCQGNTYQHNQPHCPTAPGVASGPPGQFITGTTLGANNWPHTFYAQPTCIVFVTDGQRPCDTHGRHSRPFRMSRHFVPSNITVRDLIFLLGCPSGADKGVTEMFLLANDEFGEGRSFTQGGSESAQTLAAVGWAPSRTQENAVWLVVKR